MRTQSRQDVFTLADLDDWPESTLIELHEGSIVVNPQPITRHQLAVHRAMEWLVQAGIDRGHVLHAIGIAFDNEPGDGFIPDVMVIGGPLDPDLLWQPPSAVRIVVEVLSPSTRRRDLGHKRDVYLSAGLTVALIDPVDGIVEVAGPDAWIADTPY